MKVNRDLLAELARAHSEKKGLKHSDSETEILYFVDWVLAPYVNTRGQADAAAKFGASQQVISKWLKQYNYVKRISWMKLPTAQEQADIQAAAERVQQWRQEHGVLDED